MNNLTITLRSSDYSGTITDADGIVFLSVLFDNEELRLLERGLAEEAYARFQDRYTNKVQAQLDRAQSELEKQKIGDKLDKELAQFIYQRIQRHVPTRSVVAARILECFPEIPENLVYWHSESKFGIRLNSEETMQLFLSIIKLALVEVQPQTTKSESTPIPKQIVMPKTFPSKRPKLRRY